MILDVILLVVGFSIIVFHSEKALKYENKNEPKEDSTTKEKEKTLWK